MPPIMIDTPFGFSLNLSFWQDIFALPTNQVINALLAIFGWTILALIFFYMGQDLWVKYREKRYMSHWKWVVLAVDIPPMFIQSPKAVEQIFAHFSGAQIGPNVIEKYRMGRRQKYFSLEIVSIEGYIQFLIRTEVEFRDLVEAAIYAQYPEAEITEVEDYVEGIPSSYPNDDYDVFGAEFHLEKDEVYPIRTYASFEYSLSKDVVFSDPMAAILENFTRIGKGENFWMEIVLQPTGSSWKERAIEVVKAIVENKKSKPKEGVFSLIANLPKMIMALAIQIWDWNFEGGAEAKAEVAPVGKVQDLTPGKKDTVQAIEEKVAKLGFKSKLRILYSAHKEVFNPSHCFDGFVGAINQFNIQSRNAIVPYKITKLHYAFKDLRLGWLKSRFVRAFKKRLLKPGGKPYVLNIEELATLWHFPLPFVKAPLVQKATAKRGEPPIDLPTESLENPIKRILPQPPMPEESAKSVSPEELPYA